MPQETLHQSWDGSQTTHLWSTLSSSLSPFSILSSPVCSTLVPVLRSPSWDSPGWWATWLSSSSPPSSSSVGPSSLSSLISSSPSCFPFYPDSYWGYPYYSGDLSTRSITITKVIQPVMLLTQVISKLGGVGASEGVVVISPSWQRWVDDSSATCLYIAGRSVNNVFIYLFNSISTRSKQALNTSILSKHTENQLQSQNRNKWNQRNLFCGFKRKLKH